MRSSTPAVLAAGCLLVAVLSGCGEQRSPAGEADADPTPGCGPAAPIDEPTYFVPYDSRHHYPAAPIKATEVDPAVVSAAPFREEIDGLPAQGMHVQQDFITVFYAEEPLPDMDPDGVVASGGLALQFEPVTSGRWDPRSFFAEVETRVNWVRVGDHEGVLTWADPDADGNRAHYLTWGKGNRSWQLVGLREPEELVALARGLVC